MILCVLSPPWKLKNNIILQSIVIKSGTGQTMIISVITSKHLVSRYDIGTPIDILWNVFKEMCLKCLDMIPSKCYEPGTSLPRINSTIKCLSHRKQRLYNLARSSKCNDAWQRY